MIFTIFILTSPSQKRIISLHTHSCRKVRLKTSVHEKIRDIGVPDFLFYLIPTSMAGKCILQIDGHSFSTGSVM